MTRGLEIPTEDQQEGGKNVEQKRKQATQAREAWIDRSGVVVKRAPQGLKRSRENKTDVVKYAHGTPYLCVPRADRARGGVIGRRRHGCCIGRLSGFYAMRGTRESWTIGMHWPYIFYSIVSFWWGVGADP